MTSVNKSNKRRLTKVVGVAVKPLTGKAILIRSFIPFATEVRFVSLTKTLSMRNYPPTT